MRRRYRYSLLLVVVLAAFVGTGWAAGASSAFFSDSEASTGTVQAAERFPYFSVSIDDTNSPVTEGEPLHVNATITNNGSVNATQQLRLNVTDQTNPEDTREVSTRELAVRNNSSETVTLTWNTTTEDGGNGVNPAVYNVTLSSEDESNTTSVEVEDARGNGNPGGNNGNAGGNDNCNGNGC